MSLEDPLVSIIDRLDSLSLHDYETLLDAIARRLLALDQLAAQIVAGARSALSLRRRARYSDAGE